MIGIDWGTSSLRAFRLAADGTVRERRQAPRGILSVTDGAFAAVIEEIAGDWLHDGEDRVLLSGMIGSRQGWRESQTLSCPVGIDDLSRALTPVPLDGARAFIIPGLAASDAQGTPEVMRGEETQIAGVLASIGDNGVACLPGTHCKWVRIAHGRIAGFTTHMTGEAFAALSGHTILGRLMRGVEDDEAAFDRGVARAADPGGLLHHLFGARTLVLTGRLADTATRSYLSGLLIGHEIRAATPAGGEHHEVHIVGEAKLCRHYARALASCGIKACIETGDAAVLGLARIGGLVHWA
jgi:2-dehydro-3-deoxygalactonokinase